MSTPAAAARPWEADDYLAAVGRRLDDLPADERSALLEDLALHLEALRAEGDGRPVAVRLGPADDYAAELRAAAGLPPRVEATAPAGAGLQHRVAAFLAHRATGEVRRLLAELRPAWWVLRGYLAVLVLSSLSYGQREGLLPTPLGSGLLGVLLVLAAVVGSVALGRRALSRRNGGLVTAAGVLLGLVALVQVGDTVLGVDEAPYYAESYPVAAEQALGEYPLLSRSGPVTDVLPYASDGTPLTGVLLYDQDGRPLQVGLQQWWADGCTRLPDHPLAADGVPVPFSYPQQYALDPRGVDPYGAPVSLAGCETQLARPDVPLPVFPSDDADDSGVATSDGDAVDDDGAGDDGVDDDGVDEATRATATPGG